jgi:hypothetical protein
MNMGTPRIKMDELAPEGLVMASMICEQVSFKRDGNWDQVYEWHIDNGGSVSMTRHCIDMTFSLPGVSETDCLVRSFLLYKDKTNIETKRYITIGATV